ncbi:hypothetical protein MgSA37_03570 [Mucilaginibacter gotjawali]|uniref:Uncharacterized protein n=2 Tax=Mucilaginibacter gotjawali TaxID=1550579 RepID=A0A839SGT5_9SPHI|nr:hypothetical protein [Mucilaginibacter gotjawali]BAU55386.1 hypothetical protein MgSA37_03570 [Mucilaginibacter gotjawali]
MSSYLGVLSNIENIIIYFLEFGRFINGLYLALENGS